MIARLFVEGFASLTAEGICSRTGLLPWEPDQQGPVDVRRSQVLNAPLPSFGKLMLPDKLAFGVVSVLVTNSGITLDESIGVCMENPCGSLSTDLRYAESVASGTPSPALFSATLPSSAVSEITIFYKLRGPNRVLAGKDTGGLACLDAAARLIASRKAQRMLVVLVRALDAQDCRSLPGGTLPAAAQAYALLVSATASALSRPLCIDVAQSVEPAQSTDGADYLRVVIGHLSAGTCAHIQVTGHGYAGAISLDEGRDRGWTN
jgi:hypothetical protein